MKQFFQITGFIFLMIFSFFYTNASVEMVKTVDDLMIHIKDDKDNYYQPPIDASIDNNYIIPGLSGHEINIDSSYDVLKKLGKYSPNLLVYNYIKPKISLSDNYDKYIISGNKSKKEVTLIFKLDKIDNLSLLLSKLDINANFVIDNKILYNNQNIILSLLNNNHNIILNDNTKINYSNSIIKKQGKQELLFCYTEIDNNELLNNCFKNNKYTIKPSIITTNNPLIEIKKNITNGSIISLNVDIKTIKELPLIIKYINSKGYNIKNLVDFLKE